MEARCGDEVKPAGLGVVARAVLQYVDVRPGEVCDDLFWGRVGFDEGRVLGFCVLCCGGAALLEQVVALRFGTLLEGERVVGEFRVSSV